MLVVASPAEANIGAPMIILIAPASWALLLLIIPIEAAVGVWTMRERLLKLIKISAAANLLSTIVGIPVTWLLMVIIQMLIGGGSAWGIETAAQKLLAVTIQSPWLIPYESEFGWMVPSAAAFLCIPFFFMSVWCEQRVACKFFSEDKSRINVKRWVWRANAVTYGIIIAALVSSAVLSIAGI